MNKQPFRLGTGGDWGFRGGDRGVGSYIWRCSTMNKQPFGAQAIRIRGHKRRRNLARRPVICRLNNHFYKSCGIHVDFFLILRIPGKLQLWTSCFNIDLRRSDSSQSKL